MRHVLWLVLVVVLSGVGAGSAAEDDNRSWLGVYFGSAPDGNSGRSGVLLQGIVRDSPAERAGLRARDIIVAIEGREVGPDNGLAQLVSTVAPGGWVELTVVRGDDELDVRLRLGDRPTRRENMEIRRGWIGATAIDLPEPLREHFGAPAEAGVMVSGIRPGSPAEAAGLRLGDVIYEISGRPIAGRKSFKQATAFGGVGNEIEVTAARDGTEIVLELMILERPDEPAEAGSR